MNFCSLAFEALIHHVTSVRAYEDRHSVWPPRRETAQGRMDARTTLAKMGFDVLTEVDVKATLKKKLDIEMPAYHILGAYNLKMACSGIGMEPRVGVMLPCN
jgi:hypothetical protein